MSILEKLKNRTKIDVDKLIERLKKELSTKDNEQIEYSLYDTLVIILDVTHQPKVPEGLYTTWLRMTKDYWYLNGFDKIVSGEGAEGETQDKKTEQGQIKSIAIGDTTTTFVDQSSQVEINGIRYNTGTVEFSEDALIEKYKKDLYRHRKMRW